MSAALKRRVALLEAKLSNEMAMHDRTTNAYRSTVHELVELKLRNQAAIDALSGLDYFGVAK